MPQKSQESALTGELNSSSASLYVYMYIVAAWNVSNAVNFPPMSDDTIHMFFMCSLVAVTSRILGRPAIESTNSYHNMYMHECMFS